VSTVGSISGVTKFAPKRPDFCQCTRRASRPKVPNRRNSWALQPGAAFRLGRNFNPDFEQTNLRPFLSLKLHRARYSCRFGPLEPVGPLEFFPATRQNRIFPPISECEAWIYNVVSQFFIRLLGHFGHFTFLSKTAPIFKKSSIIRRFDAKLHQKTPLLDVS